MSETPGVYELSQEEAQAIVVALLLAKHYSVDHVLRAMNLLKVSAMEDDRRTDLITGIHRVMEGVAVMDGMSHNLGKD